MPVMSCVTVRRALVVIFSATIIMDLRSSRTSRVHRRLTGYAPAKSEGQSAMSAVVFSERAQRVTLGMAAGAATGTIRHSGGGNSDKVHSAHPQFG
jgi:hypothetical protein